MTFHVKLGHCSHYSFFVIMAFFHPTYTLVFSFTNKGKFCKPYIDISCSCFLNYFLNVIATSLHEIYRERGGGEDC